ncbi:MAG TPA: hypothetical protein VFE47_02695 [Tepidisphaeraceae bacterium]|nr:hypothetical protein [Tepidisphaeraceae bacterium]
MTDDFGSIVTALLSVNRIFDKVRNITNNLFTRCRTQVLRRRAGLRQKEWGYRQLVVHPHELNSQRNPTIRQIANIVNPHVFRSWIWRWGVHHRQPIARDGNQENRPRDDRGVKEKRYCRSPEKPHIDEATT